MAEPSYCFYEFFAGGGMARIGLGPRWRCLFANDIDPVKCAAYRSNFNDDALLAADVRSVTTEQLPGRADLAWASFPCQDLSLAGARGGLAGARSGTFFAFWRSIRALRREGRAPRMIAIENVAGLLTSGGGADFTALVETVVQDGYRITGFVLDGARFVPQSRARVFLLAFDDSCAVAARAKESQADDARGPARHKQQLAAAVAALPDDVRAAWVWTDLPAPPEPNARLIDIVERPAPASLYFDPPTAEKLLAQMAPRHRAEIDARARAGGRHVGAGYRRIRTEGGTRVQRVEVRFDGLAGCLRTPAGGSSRQFIFEIDDGAVRARLLSPREGARLMGLGDDYVLPASATAAYRVLGDGVVAPAVRWLSERIIEPALAPAKAKSAA